MIVIFEVLYYKHKGWRKQQQKVLKRTTDQWQECVQERKNRDNENKFISINRNNGVQQNGTQLNGVSNNHDKNGVTLGVQNPAFANEDALCLSSNISLSFLLFQYELY